MHAQKMATKFLKQKPGLSLSLSLLLILALVFEPLPTSEAGTVRDLRGSNAAVQELAPRMRRAGPSWPDRVISATPTAREFNTSSIMNGHDADSWTALHMAALVSSFKSGNSVMCSGTIISARFVVTAAHCVHRGTSADALTDVRVWVGRTEPRSGRTYFASAVFVHAQYVGRVSRNDLAVIASDAAFARGTFRAATLARGRRALSAGKLVYTSGYGLVSTGADGDGVSGPVEQASRLQTVVLRVERVRTCRHFFARAIARAMSRRVTVCATDPRFPYAGDAGVCSGDSGGPLYTKKANGQIVVLGVLSFATTANCLDEGQVAGYFNVRAAVRLIDTLLKGNYTVMNEVLTRA